MYILAMVDYCLIKAKFKCPIIECYAIVTEHCAIGLNNFIQ